MNESNRSYGCSDRERRIWGRNPGFLPILAERRPPRGPPSRARLARPEKIMAATSPRPRVFSSVKYKIILALFHITPCQLQFSLSPNAAGLLKQLTLHCVFRCLEFIVMVLMKTSSHRCFAHDFIIF